jgi:hypothetical protein
MRVVLATMLLLALIVGAFAGIMAWYIDYTNRITGNQGFNGVLAIASVGGMVLGVGLLALLRVEGISILVATLRGSDRARVAMLGPLGWATMGIVGVSLYCLVFALIYGIVGSFTLGMFMSSWPSGHYLAFLLAGFIIAMWLYLVVVSHQLPRP